jgi:hypothetical protein
VLPHADDPPTASLEESLGIGVTSDVACDLAHPELDVPPRPARPVRPEALTIRSSSVPVTEVAERYEAA